MDHSRLEKSIALHGCGRRLCLQLHRHAPSSGQFTFDGGAGLYSAFLAAMGIGAVCGGLFTAHRSRPSQKLLALIGAIFGSLILAVGFSPTKTVALLFLVPMGAASISFIATNNAILQLRSEPDARSGHVPQRHRLLGSTPSASPPSGGQRCHRSEGCADGRRYCHPGGQHSPGAPCHQG